MAKNNEEKKTKFNKGIIKNIIIVVSIAGFFIIAIYADKRKSGDWEEKSVTKTSYDSSSSMRTTTSIENLDGTGYKFNVNLEEVAQEIIDTVNADYTNSEVIKRYLGEDEEQQVKYLTQFIKAEYATKYPDLRSRDKIGTPVEEDEFQGRIVIKRDASGMPEGNSNIESTLEYKDYDEFMELVDKNDPSVLNYFTLQDSTYVRMETSWEKGTNQEQEDVTGNPYGQTSHIGESQNKPIEIKHMSQETSELIALDDVTAWRKVTGGIATAEQSGNRVALESYLKGCVKSIEFPVRVWANPGDKYDLTTTTSTMKKTVNGAVAQLFIDFFTDLYENCPNFVIDKSTTGAGSILRRGDWSSAHYYGCAMDINWDTKGMTYGTKGSVHGPYTKDEWETWEETHEKYQTIYYGSPMEELIHKYTLDWGGQWNSCFDGMHISFVGDNTRKYVQDIAGVKTIAGNAIYENAAGLSQNSNVQPSMDLIVATWTETTTEVETNEEGVESTKETVVSISTRKFNYQSITNKFSLPFDVLWDLLVLSEDANFASDVVDLALNSKIIITVQDNLSVSINKDEYNYEIEDIERQNVSVRWDDQSETSQLYEYKQEPVPYWRTTTTTVKTNSVNIDVTYADTWILEYINSYHNEVNNVEEVFNKTYTKDDLDSLQDLQVITRTAWDWNHDEQAVLEEKVNEFDETKEWLKDKKKSLTSSAKYYPSDNEIRNYLSSYTSSYLQRNEEDEMRRGVVTSIIRNNQNRIVSIVKSSNFNLDRNEFASEYREYRPHLIAIINATHTFYADNQYEETNTADVKISSVYRENERNTINRTQEITDYAGNNRYIQGTPIVREKTKSIATMSTIGFDWVKAWESGSLFNYLYLGNPWNNNKLITEDGKYYICYDERPLNNTLNFGFGFKFTNDGFSGSDQGYKESIENVRRLYQGLHNLESMEGISDEEAIKEIKTNYGYVGAKIPVEAVDFATEEEYMAKRNGVLRYIEKAQQIYGGPGVELFTTAQLDALTMRCYNGWGTRENDTIRIYKCLLDGNLEQAANIVNGNNLREGVYKKAFIEGVYIRRGNEGELNPEGYSETGEVEFKTNFISLVNKYTTVRRKLISGAEIFFEQLETSPNASEQVDIMKWLFYLLTGKDKYGVTEIDWLGEIKKVSKFNFSTGCNFNVNTLLSDPKLVIDTDEEVQMLLDAVHNLGTSFFKRQEAIDNIDNFIDYFREMQDRYHVNLVFAIAVAKNESQMGTSWSAIDKSTHNLCSISSPAGTGYHNPNSSNSHWWKIYPDFETAILEFGNYIGNNSDYYFTKGDYTVAEIAKTYCSENWGKEVNSIMKTIYHAMGINVGSDFTFGIDLYNEDESVNLEALYNLQLALEEYVGLPHCTSSVEKPENGYKVNNLDVAKVKNFNIKYWNAPYSGLEIFQCTWWANGRASMYLDTYGTKYNKYPTQYGHGKHYFSYNKWFNSGKEPKPNSILSKQGGKYGHVVFVEAVDYKNRKVYISSAGGGTHWNGISSISFDSLRNWDGFIYLDEPL